jgi:cytochrome c biogenesis protein CcmG/thiol:disulfide interchange protein DsbE
MKRKILILPIILFFTLLIVFFYLLVIDRNPSELPSVLINKEVPSFQAKSLMTKKTFISEKEFDGEIILVNFFATWCAPCLQEHVYLKKLSNQKGLKIIGINYKDDSTTALAWLKKLGNPYADVIADNKGHIGIDWGVYGLPETFIIDSKGVIKYRLIGAITKKTYKAFYSKVMEIENL